MAEAATKGMSIKERQALLSATNRNPVLAGEPVRAAIPKPTPPPKSSVLSPPALNAALRPVAERKPFGAAAGGSANGAKPSPPTSLKPLVQAGVGRGGGGTKAILNGETTAAAAGGHGEAGEEGVKEGSGGKGAVSQSPFLKNLRPVEAPAAAGKSVESGGHAPTPLIPPKKTPPFTLPKSPSADISTTATALASTATSTNNNNNCQSPVGDHHKAADGAVPGVGVGGSGGGQRKSSNVLDKIAALQAKSPDSPAAGPAPGVKNHPWHPHQGDASTHPTASPTQDEQHSPYPTAAPITATLAAALQKPPSVTAGSHKPGAAVFGQGSGIAPASAPFLPKPASPALPGLNRAELARGLKEAVERKAHHRNPDLYLRKSDQRKFRKLDSEAVASSGQPPAKPKALDNVDLTAFVRTYAAAKEKKIEVDASRNESPMPEADNGNGSPDELSVEAESTHVTLRGNKGSIKRAQSARVSMIPEYSEKEEELDLYVDGTSTEPHKTEGKEPREIYDDCTSSVPHVVSQSPPSLEDPDEIYEPLDEELPDSGGSIGNQKLAVPIDPVTPPPRSPNASEDKKAKKEKEKAAKKKDKEKDKDDVLKKEEKERRKKEEEMRKQRSKFGLTDADQKEGEGVVKAKDSGGLLSSSSLAVKQGETVVILRMEKNPSGKWLVQNEQGKIGYVNSSNIEVSTSTIRSLMTSATKKEDAESEEQAEPEELYEALPEEGEMDDIYEETS